MITPWPEEIPDASAEFFQGFPQCEFKTAIRARQARQVCRSMYSGRDKKPASEGYRTRSDNETPSFFLGSFPRPWEGVWPRNLFATKDSSL